MLCVAKFELWLGGWRSIQMIPVSRKNGNDNSYFSHTSATPRTAASGYCGWVVCRVMRSAVQWSIFGTSHFTTWYAVMTLIWPVSAHCALFLGSLPPPRSVIFCSIYFYFLRRPLDSERLSPGWTATTHTKIGLCLQLGQRNRFTWRPDR
jgi:hypothetical protein